MVETGLLRGALLLGPAIAVSLLVVGMRQPPRVLVGAMLSTLWNIPALLAVNMLAAEYGWWSFDAVERTLAGMPVDVLFGWALFWGALPALGLRGVNLLALSLAMIWIDALSMPKLAPLVTLGDGWIIGDLVAVATCFVPAQLLARDTARREHLTRRATLQGVGYGLWLVLLIPAVAAEHLGVDLIDRIDPSIPGSILLVPIGFLLLIGLSALYEFAHVGSGTPIPFDPPQRLVASGPYAFMANPMQVVSIAVTVLLGVWLDLWPLHAVAISFWLYCIGLVAWHHDVDAAVRLGDAWGRYKAVVPNWRPLWRPYVPGESVLHVEAAAVGSQSIMRWLRHFQPIGLRIVIGSGCAAVGGSWASYRHADSGGMALGISAVARAFEHTNLALAMVAWIVRLPGAPWSTGLPGEMPRRKDATGMRPPHE